MNCMEYRALIDDSLDTSLKGSLEQRVGLHLEHCAACRIYYERRQKEHSALFAALNAAYAEVRLPSASAARIQDEMILALSRRRSFFARLPRWARIAAALAALLGGMVFAAHVGNMAFALFDDRVAADEGADALEKDGMSEMSETTMSPIFETTGHVGTQASPEPTTIAVQSAQTTSSTTHNGETTMNSQNTNTLARTVVKTMAVAALALGAPTLAAGDATVNTWQGTSGGQWGNPANWSLNRIPAATDYVVFPDTGNSYTINVDTAYQCGTFYVDYRLDGQTSEVSLTLTGGGSVTAIWAAGSPNQHVVRNYRKLILDNVLLALNGNNLLLYKELELKNGASYTSDDALYFWTRGTKVTVGQGCSFAISGAAWMNNDNGTIIVNDGAFRCDGGVRMVSGEHPVNVSVAGGEVEFNGLPLYDGASLSISGGSMKVKGGGLVLAETTTLNLTGGSLEIRERIASIYNRLVLESRGTDISTLASSGSYISSPANCTLDFLGTNLTVRLAGQVSSINGGCALRSGSVLEGEEPFHVKAFFNEPLIEKAATLRLKTIVFGGATPFQAVGSESAAKRYVNIEGPTTIRAFSDMSKPGHGFYPMVSGTVTVDTRDWNDPSVQRKLYLGLGTCTAADLVFMGGGEVGLYQPQPYRGEFSSITVSNDTTLTLSDQGRSHVRTEVFTLGPGAVLNIPAGTNTVYAKRWNIDPTATINLIVPSWMGGRACAALVDAQGGSLADYADRLNVTGDGAAGWSVSHQGGVLAIVKSAGAVDGTYAYEWTGNAGNANFSEAGNWYCNQKPPQDQVHAFGAADAVASPFFDNVWYGDNNENKGYSVGSILFRATAVKSFTIHGDVNVNMTCNSSVNYWGRQVPSANDPATWGVYSQSDLPQTIATGTLRSGTLLSVAAVGAGPIVVDSALAAGSESYGNLYVGGEVRLAKPGLSVPRIVMPNIGGGDAVFGTRLTLLSGASLAVLRQDGVVTYGTAGAMFGNGAMFNVEADATLTFAAGSGAEYKWSCSQPGKSLIDGTLNILAPYVNAANVVYGGSGRINVSEFRCSSASGSLGLAGSVNLYPPAAWNTVDSYGANAPFVLKAYETPTIHLSRDWTYGPAAVVAGTTDSSASDRACEIAKEATLTIDGNGHTATFSDPVSGRGTLAVTNGTVRMNGGNDATISLKVCRDGVFAWNTAVTVASLDMDAGAALSCGYGVPLTVNGNIGLDGVAICAENAVAFERATVWQTLLVARSGTISGTPVIPGAWRTRIDDTSEGQVFQARYFHGMVIIFR